MQELIFLVLIFLGISLLAGTVIYRGASYFLRRTWSLLAGAAVALSLLTMSVLFLEDDWHSEDVPIAAREPEPETAALPESFPEPMPEPSREPPSPAAMPELSPERPGLRRRPGEPGQEAPPVLASEPESAPSRVVASRLFAGPNQYPPEEFTAYGILAFRSRASSQDRLRHLFICEAYITSLPHSSELNTARSEQMVTVWPIFDDWVADKTNRMPRDQVCFVAVNSYGFVTALQALKEAELAGVDTFGIGPFLLAWSPSREKGEKDALVLVSNLSNVTTFRQAQDIFLKWSREIEQNPELWRNGWNIEKLRVAIRLWVDQYGPQILALFGAKE